MLFSVYIDSQAPWQGGGGGGQNLLCYCYVIVMLLLCYCYVIVLLLLCYCNVIVMLLLCYCYVLCKYIWVKDTSTKMHMRSQTFWRRSHLPQDLDRNELTMLLAYWPWIFSKQSNNGLTPLKSTRPQYSDNRNTHIFVTFLLSFPPTPRKRRGKKKERRRKIETLAHK